MPLNAADGCHCCCVPWCVADIIIIIVPLCAQAVIVAVVLL